jgi:hypothetical protein
LSNALDSALRDQPLNHRLVQHIAQSLQHEADVLKQEVQELGDQLRASAGKRPHSTSFAAAARPPGARPDVLCGARDSRGDSGIAGGSSDAGDYSEGDLYKDVSGEEARLDASALRDSIELMRREGRPYARPDVGGGTAGADSSAHISSRNADATRRVLRDWPQTDSRDFDGDDRQSIFFRRDRTPPPMWRMIADVTKSLFPATRPQPPIPVGAILVEVVTALGDAIHDHCSSETSAAAQAALAGAVGTSTRASPARGNLGEQPGRPSVGKYHGARLGNPFRSSATASVLCDTHEAGRERSMATN